MRALETLLKSPATMTGLFGAARRRSASAMTWLIWPHWYWNGQGRVRWTPKTLIGPSSVSTIAPTVLRPSGGSGSWRRIGVREAMTERAGPLGRSTRPSRARWG
jgi:hypothetical protein